MKKTRSILLVFMLILSITASSYASSNPIYSTVTPLEGDFKAQSIYLGDYYDEHSDEGYREIIDPTIGRYFVRLREIRLIKGPADDDPVRNYRDFGYVYRTDNFTGTLQESVSIQDSVQHTETVTSTVGLKLGISGGALVKVNTEVSFSVAQAIGTTVGHTITKQFSQGYSFGFPTQNAPSNCTKAKRGVGFQYDTYRSITDIKKEVDVEKFVNIVQMEWIGDESRCLVCGHGDCHDFSHEQELIIHYRITLADGSVEYINSEEVDQLIDWGVITPDMSQWKRMTKEWRVESVVGEVLVPTVVMVTIYMDQYGNILDSNGNII